MSEKIDIGNGQKIVITQGVGDLKTGWKYGDLSRISAYAGNDVGVHTGSDSPTIGRHDQPFGKK